MLRLHIKCIGYFLSLIRTFVLEFFSAKTSKKYSFMYSKIYKKTKNYSELEIIAFVTGKSFSEALILASTNPQYGKRLFIELPGLLMF